MTAYSGRDFLLKVYNGSTYDTLGGMRTTGMTLNNNPIDVSSKTTGAWRALLTGAGIRSLSLSAAGIFEDSTAEEGVRAAAFAASALDCELQFANGDTLQGLFLVANYERSGEVDAEEAYSVTLESAGPITFTAAV